MTWPWKNADSRPWRKPRGPAGGERCHACRDAPVQTVLAVDVDDEDTPGYHVCHGCEDRLLTSSLRPVEWYNLAVRYGATRALLHDDLYSEDGAAEQPNRRVRNPHQYPAPTLSEVRNDVERLLDYCSTRYRLDEATRNALAAHDPRRILESFDRRLAASLRADMEAVALEICAEVLGRQAEEWVRGRWEGRSGVTHPLIRASAACLPDPEGYDRSVAALDALPPKQRPWDALAYFRSPRTLDWIEANLQRPVTSDWGALAAASGLSWERASRWLDAGRPLSLVALDALLAILDPGTVHTRRQQTALASPAPVDEMLARLNEYARADPAPRMTDSVRAITHYLLEQRS
ncbi:MAG TPA: hypothetical protein VFJ82_12175 [Longimicrobium sp.]|nr:hypothetical protein [Longimicrobium sp.]